MEPDFGSLFYSPSQKRSAFLPGRIFRGGFSKAWKVQRSFTIFLVPGDSKCPFHPLVGDVGGSLNPLKGSLNHPKKVTSNHLVRVLWTSSNNFWNGGFRPLPGEKSPKTNKNLPGAETTLREIGQLGLPIFVTCFFSKFWREKTFMQKRNGAFANGCKYLCYFFILVSKASHFEWLEMVKRYAVTHFWLVMMWFVIEVIAVAI